MASIIPHKNGWRALVCTNGQRRTKVFDLKRDAEIWSARTQIELTDQILGKTGEKKTLLDALHKYSEIVAPTHKGAQWEIVRLKQFESDNTLPLKSPLAKITPQMLSAWRDLRLTKVQPGSVIREMSLLSSVFSYARRDWNWISKSPLEDVRKPSQPKNRERVITWPETKGMLRALGYRPGDTPQSLNQVVALSFMLALRTGMRAGELLKLQWVDVRSSWVVLDDSKNGEGRDVPLSKKALRLIDLCRGQEKPLPILSQTRDALFRKARDKAGLEGFTFHDSRHTAATRIGRTVGQVGRLSFPEFCRVFGWKDPKHALIYVNPTGAELAAKLL